MRPIAHGRQVSAPEPVTGRDSLEPSSPPLRAARRRLPLRSELTLAALPTATILVVLAVVEALTEQRLLFASLASSAFLIYLDPEHGANRLAALVGAQVVAALTGWAGYALLGGGYLSAGVALVATITIMIWADLVHPPAVATAMSFALRAGEASNLALFLLALGITASLVVMQRVAIWEVVRSTRQASSPRGARASARHPAPADAPADVEEAERLELLERVSRMMERPALVLAVAWLVLIVLELTRGLSPVLTALSYAIWAVFALQFLVELVIAPRKGAYLRRNWLTAAALLLPALRVFRAVRAFRALRALRGARLIRVVSTANRGMRTLGSVMERRGLGYVLALTLVVNLLGAAGIYAFERGGPDAQVTSFGTALWWTAMTLTTMGADFAPRTGEGRLLALLLAIYAFTVFGYVTASLATFFIARDRDFGDGEDPGGPR